MLLLLCVAALTLAACRDGGGGDADAGAATPDPEPTVTPAAPAAPVEGRFDVGGHALYLRCQGAGPATVVYLHPYVDDAADLGSEQAGRLPELLAPHLRICVYDRANVGRSDEARGTQDGRASARDLRALLAAAGVDGPYVLLGSGFGALIAQIFAAAHPAQVAGMVMVDGRLPGDLDVQERFFPPAQRLQPGVPPGAVERIDQLETFRAARRLEGDQPRVPVTYVGPKDLEVDPALPANRVVAAWRDSQQTFLDRFAPGRLVLLDTGRPMEGLAAERIAEEVLRVVGDAREAAQGEPAE